MRKEVAASTRCEPIAPHISQRLHVWALQILSCYGIDLTMKATATEANQPYLIERRLSELCEVFLPRYRNAHDVWGQQATANEIARLRAQRAVMALTPARSWPTSKVWNYSSDSFGRS